IIKLLLDYGANADNIIKSGEHPLIHKLMINRRVNYNDTCSICLENNKIPMMKTKCGHLFHIQCIEKWMLSNRSNCCPNCRGSLSFGNRKKSNHRKKSIYRKRYNYRRKR